LAISRERLRLALHAPRPPSKAHGTDGLGWLNALQSEPCTRLVREALGPIAQRNPLGLMLVAFAAGGLIALTKPWRWIPLPAILAGVLPEILAKLMAQAPPSTWLDALEALIRRSGSTEDPSPK
jgi:hypothetical protein